MVRLLIFDFDGTLFHTAPGIHLAVNMLLRERGLEEVDYETSVGFIGGGFTGLAKKLQIKYDHDLSSFEGVVADFKRHYEEVYLENSEIYPGVLEFLKSWPHQLSIVSNKSEYFVRRLVEQSELKDFAWSSIIGGDSFKERKPHPRPLQEAMKTAGAHTGNSLMIGDGSPDIEAAENAGLRGVAVDYGYTEVEKLLELGAKHRISCLTELPVYIEQLDS